MPYEFSIFAILMGAVGVLALFLLFYSLFFRLKSHLTVHFIALVISTAIWVIGYSFEILAVDKPTMMFWTYIEYIGILTISPLLLLFVLAFTQRSGITTKPLLSLLFFPSFVHYLFLLTNDYHSLFYQSVTLNDQTPFVSLELNYGPLFYTNTIYSYLLLIVGYSLLIRTYLTSQKIHTLYQKQLLIVVVATSVPIIGNIIWIFRLLKPFEFLDITPIFFVIAYVIFAYALFEIGFLDIVPIARHRVFAEILDGLVVLDRERRVVDINTAAQDIMFPGMNLSLLMGKNIFSVLRERLTQKVYHPKINEVEKGLTKIETGESMFSTDLERLYPRHEIQKEYYDLLAAPLRSHTTRELLGFVVILRNVTDRVTAKLTLQQQNYMQELILKLLSHDLHNHLNVLKGYSEVAAEATNLEETREGLLAIQVKSNATLKLIDEVTSYLKSEDALRSSPFEKSDLNEVINNTIKQLQPEADSKEIIIKQILPENPTYVLANLALNSVIFNLLSNAIKFSPTQGVIEIRLEGRNNLWQVNVADQGPGIPEDLKEKVFEPFAAYGEKKGTGLGLTIARETIHFFLGRIWIEDVQPNGTKFLFEIPKIAE